ncbi:hypothetical protein IWZ01DRAFT_542933 [Phyllosticta capitalensis]
MLYWSILKDDKLFYYATDSRTHESSGTAFTTDESLIFLINPKLLLGLCVRNLIKHQFHFSRNKRVADWLGLTCPPGSLPPGFPGKLAYEEHCSLDWMKQTAYFRK